MLLYRRVCAHPRGEFLFLTSLNVYFDQLKTFHDIETSKIMTAQCESAPSFAEIRASATSPQRSTYIDFPLKLI